MKKRPRVSRKSGTEALTAVQGDLFAPDPGRLPEDKDLARMYADFNQRYFGGALGPAQVMWSQRMRIAGNCRPETREIRLSIQYHTFYPDELESTLLHEMLHLLYPTHDASFRHAAEKLGVSLHCREYPGIQSPSRHVYVCPGCNSVFYRRKRANLACASCSGGTYDERFKLLLKSSPSRFRQGSGGPG
jgi:predicted SprT family Zn-dependent metalloprotease